MSDILEDYLSENAPRYPQRTATQLHDLRDDLQSITNMTFHSPADQEKIALYLEHVDAIEDVQAAFNQAWESYATTCGRDVAQLLIDTEEGDQRVEGENHPRFVSLGPTVMTSGGYSELTGATSNTCSNTAGTNTRRHLRTSQIAPTAATTSVLDSTTGWNGTVTSQLEITS